MNHFLSNLASKIAPIYPQAKRWLHKFNGGVFPKYYKELSAGQPIKEGFIPKVLRIPLQQQIGLPAEVLVAVGEKVQKNQLIARSSKEAAKSLVVPIHAPTSGVIKAIEANTLPHPSGLKDLTIVLEPDMQNTTIDNILEVDGSAPKSITQLKQIILDAGIVGMGGAGFPTYAKIPEQPEKIHTLMINGAECEPFITCDDLLMQTDAQSIIQGALITANALRAKKILCGIESNKPSAIKAMQAAANAHSDDNITIEVIEVQSVYPMGGQKQLIQELTGQEIPHDAHAVDLGMLMMNVATFKAIYRAVTLGEPLTCRMVSVTGLGLNKPFNIRAMIGTAFEELAELAQPKTAINYPLIMGGPMMGFKVKDNKVPIIKTTNCVLANPPEPVEMQMPCIRCGECMDACPINLLPQQMYWHSQAREFDKVEKLNVFDCIECGCCSFVCPSHIPLVQYYRNAKSSIKEIKAEERAVDLAKKRHEFKMARIEREKQERDARLKAKKEAVKQQAKADKEANSDSAKPNVAETQKSPKNNAAAAARAAAAKRAAAKNKSTSNDAIPPARKKAIEAAQKMAKKSAAESKKQTNPKEAAKKAAMLAAKKRAALKAKKDLEVTANETQANKAVEQPNVENSQMPTEPQEQGENLTGVKKDASKAAMQAAKAAAKKRQETKENSLTATEDNVQIADLTEVTEENSALKKEKARKAAMQAARAAAKKRSQDKQKNADKNPNIADNDANPAADKRKLAMQKAKEAAAKRAAAKLQGKTNEDSH